MHNKKRTTSNALNQKVYLFKKEKENDTQCKVYRAAIDVVVVFVVVVVRQANVLRVPVCLHCTHNSPLITCTIQMKIVSLSFYFNFYLVNFFVVFRI